MNAVTKLEPIPHTADDAVHQNLNIKNGRVLSLASDHILTRIAGETVKAQKAFSCFVEPLPEDRVICAGDESGQVYILGIIERKKGRNVTIQYPSHTDMVARDGHLNIRSNQSLSLTSGDLSFFSKKAVHRSREALLSFDETTATGHKFQASFKTVKFISRMIHTMAKQMLGSFQGYIRNTEDNDQVRTGQMIRQSEGLYSMDSHYTIMVSKKDTKIDGERIHMG